MQSFVGRQPVISAGNQVAAYQILFDPRYGSGPSATGWSTRELCRLLLRIGWRVFTGGRPFILPWDGALARDDFPPSLPRGRVILGVRANELDRAAIQELERYRLQGYRFLLDDFRGRKEDFAAVARCDFVRIDLREVRDLDAAVQSLAGVRASRIASHVDTGEDRARCLRLKIPLCQGEWLVTPDPARRGETPGNHPVLLRLLSVLNDPDVPIEEVEGLVRQDVGLSYRLVRLVNSAAIGLRHRVSSIGQAVMLLGLRHLRAWVSLSTVGLIGQKPKELMVQAMVRAFACEGLADMVGRKDRDALFTIGLFSVLDALLDRPMPEIVDGLPLTEDVKEVLAGQEASEARRILDAAIAHESGDFDAPVLRSLPIDPFLITGAYLEALVKTDHVLSGLEAFDRTEGP